MNEENICDIGNASYQQRKKEVEQAVFAQRIWLQGDELLNGQMYTCRLTGLQMLCIHEPTKWTDTQEGRCVASFRVLMRYYNHLTGLYIDLTPVNYQFALLQ